MNILIGLFAGVVATLAMDFVGILTIKRQWINLEGLRVVPSLLGRWILNFFGGTRASDIRLSPELKGEKKVGLAAHYTIGMLLGSAFPLLSFSGLLGGAVYGVLTNIFPWLLMYPSMGFGFFGHKLSFWKQLLLFSFLNHLVYGLTLAAVMRLSFILTL